MKIHLGDLIHAYMTFSPSGWHWTKDLCGKMSCLFGSPRVITRPRPVWKYVCVSCLKLLCIHEVHVLTLTCFEFEIFGDVQFSVFLSVRYQEDQLEAGFREFYVHFGSLLTRSHWKVSLEHIPELALDSLLLARCFMFLRDPLEDRCELVQVHLGACHFVRLHESSGCCAVVCWATVTEKQQHATTVVHV